jgi:hypothetical protein
VLGAIQSIQEAPTSPYAIYGPTVFYGPSVVYGSAGTFGPGRFCGRVTRVTRRVVNGERRVVGRRTRVICRTPETVAVSLYVTFAAAPPAPAG